MKHFLVYTNSNKDIKNELTKQISEYILSKGGTSTIIEDIDENNKISKDQVDNMDCVIILGGDGTILRASNTFSDVDIPILGVNLGALGFLAEVEPENIYSVIDRLFDDDYRIEERMHIMGIVYRNDTHIYEGKSLNDIVITRAGYSRIIGLKIWVNGELLDTYEADGIIVSTPTGSTGYNMSAGGPIVSPNTDLIIITPVSPHSLTSKSIVFTSEDKIKIQVVNKRKLYEEEAYTSFDGRKGIPLIAGDTIYIEKAKQTTKLIKMYNMNFYKVLRNKFN